MNDLIKYSPQAIANIQTVEEAKDGYEKLKALISYFSSDYEQAFSFAVSMIECYCRMGELIEEMKENGELVTNRPKKGSSNSTVKLVDLGISKYQSAKSQKAKIMSSEQRQDYYEDMRNKTEVPTIAGILKLTKDLAKEKDRTTNSAEEVELPSDVVMLTGDFLKRMSELEDNSVSLIFTDPPYHKEHIPKYGQLAEVAARVLKPGGSLIAYAGHYALPQILADMSEHLRYWWLISLKHGGNSARLPGKWVFVEYKPLVWFVKEGRYNNTYVADFFQSKQPTKEEHEWQQDISEAIYYIEQLTEPGELVVDPFLGSGTTLIAAGKLDRQGWGCDIDENRVSTAKERYARNNT